jgi:uncharacterized protein YndB with AHSA1/START domain
MAIEDETVRRVMILPVDRDTAWAALRDAEGLAGWLADEVELEVCAGARGSVRWDSGEERLVEVEEVQERRRIVLRWCERAGDPSIVELTLDDVPGGTRLVVIELPVLTLRALAVPSEAGRDRARGPMMVAALA